MWGVVAVEELLSEREIKFKAVADIDRDLGP